MPWVGLDGSSNPTDNFAVLDGLEWQVHVYGLPGPGLAEACQTLGLPLHVLAWRPTMRKACLTQDGLYLVRPDEHVALVDSGKSPAALTIAPNAKLHTNPHKPTENRGYLWASLRSALFDYPELLAALPDKPEPVDAP